MDHGEVVAAERAVLLAIRDPIDQLDRLTVRLARVVGLLHVTVRDGQAGVRAAHVRVEASGSAYLSYNRGRTTFSGGLVPGFPQDESPASLSSPVKGHPEASDPVLAAGQGGRFYLRFMAFDRDNDIITVAVARYQDHNDSEARDSRVYEKTTIVGKGPGRKALANANRALGLAKDGRAQRVRSSGSRISRASRRTFRAGRTSRPTTAATSTWRIRSSTASSICSTRARSCFRNRPTARIRGRSPSRSIGGHGRRRLRQYRVRVARSALRRRRQHDDSRQLIGTTVDGLSLSATTTTASSFRPARSRAPLAAPPRAGNTIAFNAFSRVRRIVRHKCRHPGRLDLLQRQPRDRPAAERGYRERRRRHRLGTEQPAELPGADARLERRQQHQHRRHAQQHREHHLRTRLLLESELRPGWQRGRCGISGHVVPADEPVGQADFNFAFPLATATGNVVTATATDLSSGNTSDFSTCLTVTGSQTFTVSN